MRFAIAQLAKFHYVDRISRNLRHSNQSVIGITVQQRRASAGWHYIYIVHDDKLTSRLRCRGVPASVCGIPYVHPVQLHHLSIGQ